MKYEELLLEGQELDIYEMDFKKDIKGLYADGVIGINKRLSNDEKVCVLAEELGHYHTSVGNILDQKNVSNVKQERKARGWAYYRLVPPEKLIDAFTAGCSSRYETASFIGVTESFLVEALNYYREKYGLCIQIENYLIYFDPLGIVKFY